MAWDPTMPTNFTDGQLVTETHLDPIVTNILDLRDSLRVVQGRVMNTAGPSGISTTETTITGLQLPSVPVENGKWYMVYLTIYCNMTAVSSFFFRVRKTTALTGAVVIQAPYLMSQTGPLDDMKTIALPWQSAATENAVFHVSVQRLAGTGTISITGSKFTAHWVEKMGDSSGVWAVT